MAETPFFAWSHQTVTGTLSGGDVGNRTRVRKILPSNVYEHSRCLVLARVHPNDRVLPRPAAGTRKPLFRMVSGVAHAALWLCDARLCLRPESGAGGRGPSCADQLPGHWLMQPGAEQRIECDWHLCFALISRGRRLSARNSGRPSPVETDHPRAVLLYPII